MFTGIIKEIGFLKNKIKHSKAVFDLEIACKKIKPKAGDSIAVNGVCLTVVKKTNTGFWTNVVSETFKKTNLKFLNTNSPVNLEPALKMNDKFDGHFVTGHIDDIGTVLKISARELIISFPKNLSKFIAKKGSVALNGVSLTVAKVQKNKLSVALIPFTNKNTNLGILKKGDKVNIEIDIIARYLI